MQVGYARTSSTEQNAGLEAQLSALKAAGCEEIYQEQVSAIGSRPQLAIAMNFLRKGDTLIVCNISRLARSVADLLSIIKQLEGKGAALRILEFGGSAVDTKGPTGKLILTLVGAIAEFERSLMLERQLAGIAKAKAEGKYKGRAPTARRQELEIIRLRAEGKTAEFIAEKLGVNRSSVFRIIKEAKTKPPATRQDASSPSSGGLEPKVAPAKRE